MTPANYRRMVSRALTICGRTIDDRAGAPAGRVPDRSRRSGPAAAVGAASLGHGSLLWGAPRCMGNGATALAKPAEDIAP
jgi:hypothetical protein